MVSTSTVTWSGGGTARCRTTGIEGVAAVGLPAMEAVEYLFALTGNGLAGEANSTSPGRDCPAARRSVHAPASGRCRPVEPSRRYRSRYAIDLHPQAATLGETRWTGTLAVLSFGQAGDDSSDRPARFPDRSLPTAPPRVSKIITVWAPESTLGGEVGDDGIACHRRGCGHEIGTVVHHRLDLAVVVRRTTLDHASRPGSPRAAGKTNQRHRELSSARRFRKRNVHYVRRWSKGPAAVRSRIAPFSLSGRSNFDPSPSAK